MEISLVISAVGLGLASGFHCIGMCGPIALSLGITRKQSVNFYLQNIIYQLGRVVSYAFLGGIFGLLGEGFSLIGFQRYLTIFAGLTLLDTNQGSSLGYSMDYFLVVWFIWLSLHLSPMVV